MNLRQDGSAQRTVERIEGAITMALLTTALVVILAQVVMRLVFDSPLYWSEELARLLVIWVTFFGAAWVMAQGRHLAVDALSNALGRGPQLWMEITSNIIVALTCGSLAVAAVRFSMLVGSAGSPALSIPRGWYFGAAAIGLGLVAVHAVFNSWRALRGGAAIYPDRLDDALATGHTDGTLEEVRQR